MKKQHSKAFGDGFFFTLGFAQNPFAWFVDHFRTRDTNSALKRDLGSVNMDYRKAFDKTCDQYGCLEQ